MHFCNGNVSVDGKVVYIPIYMFPHVEWGRR